MKEIRTRYVSLKDENGNNFGVTFVDTPGQEIFYRMRNYGWPEDINI
jgi:translation initiation factor IF-2